MRTSIFTLFIGFSLMINAQTTPALPLPIDMHFIYLNLYGESCNYGVNLTEVNLEFGLPGVTYYHEEIVAPMYCPLSNDFCPGSNLVVMMFSQVGNKWYKNDILWFDWDNQVGDTCQLDYFGYSDVNCIVTSIDTILFADGIPRKQFHIVKAEDGTELIFYNQTNFTFIEGIGTNVMGLEYQETESHQFLSCVYDKNGLQLLQNDWFSYIGCCNANSISEFANRTFSIFPSPATDQTSLQFEAAHIPQSIQIFNATGQLMHTEKVLGRLQMQLNVSEYAKGIYTVRGRFENGEEVNERLVVE